MFQTKMKMIVIRGCFAVSAAFCVYYLATTHFEFMLSLFHYMKFNLSSISYTLIRILQVMLPIFLLSPEKFVNKPQLLKYTLYSIGMLYILGSSWILYYMTDNQISQLGNLEFTKDYLQLNALNFGYLVWDAYDAFSVLFSFIEAAVYIALAYHVARVRRKTIILYIASVILSFALPFVYVYLILGTGEFSAMFLQKNTVLLISQIFMGAGLVIAGSSRRLWQAAVWE